MKFSISNAVAFTFFLGKLIDHAASLGMDIMATELQRFIERQTALVNSGASWTVNSDHIVCCAADIDCIEGGKVIGDGDHPKYKMLATYWKSLDPGCYWGGDWKSKDSRHFGYRPKG